MGYYERNTLSTDYEGRCGNCHSMLGAKDKYCRYCGTLVGEGEFKPYKNETYCVYGPPVKELWHCPKCGYAWRSTVMGGDNPKFCPKCGSRKLDRLESEAKDFFSGYNANIDLDVVDLDHPEYFTPAEVDAILALRSDEPFEKEKAKKVLIEAGFTECEKAWEYDDIDERDQIPEMTDREAERINMELFMLEHVKGQQAYNFPHIKCPKCKGKMVSVVLKERKTSPNLPVKIPPKGLYEENGDGWSRHSNNYHCLLCGKYFD